MVKLDPCIRETRKERFARLEADLIAWGDALGISPPELVSIMGMLSCKILAAMERETKSQLLDDHIATFRTGVEICRKGLKP